MSIDLTKMSPEELVRYRDLLVAKQERIKFNRIKYTELYPWQARLANATDTNHQVFAMCANRVGKSYTGAYITACHLTGFYPDWWEGHKFKEPINAWASGVTNDTTRDILQNELCGNPADPDAHGTGAIPKELIVNTVIRRGASGRTFQTIVVQHHDPDTGEPNGNSYLAFKSYEMGEEKFFGSSLDWIWLDEQPPDNIYTQCITRTADKAGYVLCTFTPEHGMTRTVRQIMQDKKPGQELVQATWEDAPHITKEVQEQLLAQYTPDERDLRSKGIPFFGSGPVFPVSQEAVTIDDFDCPSYWPMLAGIDFGWDHPTAVVWIRWDRDTDIIYVTDCYREKRQTPIVHSAAINARPRCPVVWPHDGHQHDKGSGISLADQYRRLGVQMTVKHFINPLAPGETGKGNNKIEPGISEMLQRMQTGRFKVFKSCREWFEEFNMYHRKDGIIVALHDDLMSATRYAVQSRALGKEPSNRNAYSSPKGKIAYPKWHRV